MIGLGSTIQGRYRLDRRLGAGGMSTVYQATDTVLERPVAVKVLAEHLAEDQAFIARFRHEALAVARLNHPNIVQVFDTGTDSGHHFIVMEYVEGKSAADLLRERKHLDVGESIDLVTQACAGLEYAHRNRIVHRDVKPGNLLIADQGGLKLADFGIARATEMTRITQAGSVLGTAAYLSPEQARGEDTTAASDIYSLGVVLYQLLAGRLPREFSSLTELADAHRRPIEPLSSLNAEVPRQLERAIGVCLSEHPLDRYGSAAEMADAIKKGAAGIDAPATVALDEQLTRRMTAADAEPPTPVEHVTEATRALRSQPRARVVKGRPGPAHAAERPKPRGRTLRRIVGTLAVLILFGAGVAIAVIATSDNSINERITAPVEQDVDEQIDKLHELIDRYTQK